MLYFAYGSNLNLYRLRFRIDTFTKVCNYVLRDYRLVFDTGSWPEIAFANIVPYKGATVEGVIYKIEDWQVDELDRYESVDRGTYRKEYITMLGEPVLVYIGNTCNNGKPPADYLETIITGCTDHNLTRTSKELKQLGSILYPYKQIFKL